MAYSPVLPLTSCVLASRLLPQPEQPFSGGNERLRALGKMKTVQVRTGSWKKLDPGTAATPTSRASHSQNETSSSQPNSEISTIT